MTISILQSIQENLGYQPLRKIDSNTQQVMVDNNSEDEQYFSQAAIPAILIAIYEYTRSDIAAEKVFHSNIIDSWLPVIFYGHGNEAIKKVAAYSKLDFETTVNKMNEIANEAIRLIKDKVGAEGSLLDVKNLIASQRNDILPYLPAALQIGELLNDSTLDDRTNKMEGPVSNLIHAIGNSFSGSDVNKEK